MEKIVLHYCGWSNVLRYIQLAHVANDLVVDLYLLVAPEIFFEVVRLSNEKENIQTRLDSGFITVRLRLL